MNVELVARDSKTIELGIVEQHAFAAVNSTSKAIFTIIQSDLILATEKDAEKSENPRKKILRCTCGFETVEISEFMKHVETCLDWEVMAI